MGKINGKSGHSDLYADKMDRYYSRNGWIIIRVMHTSVRKSAN